MLAKISQLMFANTGSHFVPIGSYRDARQVAGCLSDLCLRALRVLRGSNLAFLCALRVSVVSKSIYPTLLSPVCVAKGRSVYRTSNPPPAATAEVFERNDTGRSS